MMQGSWVGVALTFQLSLPNGGPAALVYGSIFATVGATAIVLSLAEMASMYVATSVGGSTQLTRTRDPVVGAQYGWSAALAPRNPEFWSLIQGMPRCSSYVDTQNN